MRLPRSLIINGKRWRVVLKPLRWTYGWCIYRRREIQVDSELPENERAEYFLHELIHACLPEKFSETREEQMVKRLAPRLLAALRGIGWAP